MFAHFTRVHAHRSTDLISCRALYLESRASPHSHNSSSTQTTTRNVMSCVWFAPLLTTGHVVSCVLFFIRFTHVHCSTAVFILRLSYLVSRASPNSRSSFSTQTTSRDDMAPLIHATPWTTCSPRCAIFVRYTYRTVTALATSRWATIVWRRWC